MRIVVTGGTGFLGSALVGSLAREGHEVVVLTRRAGRDGAPAARGGVRQAALPPTRDDAAWTNAVHGAQVVVNLAGEPIGARRWSAAQKQRLADSRLDITRAIVRGMAGASAPPRLLVSGSAVGYYGSRAAEVLHEDSGAGSDFLAHLAVQWEAAAREAEAGGATVAVVRTGLVLGHGGALAKMLLPFKLGLGGPLGSGEQYMSWIHLDDWVALVQSLIARGEGGACNATAPEPVTNRAFAAALGRALHRPAILPVPAFALTLALGEMGQALLLSSQRAVPARALALGWTFRYPEIDAALEAVARA